MSELSEIIGTLLLRNNCVVIPSFGGFIANFVSAKVDVSKGIITPPKKALSFNKNLNNNDGLLVSTFAHENNISFDQAKDLLATKVKQMKSELSKGKRVHFQNVGFLYTNKSGNIAFEQDRFFNLLLSSYGLGNVQFIVQEEKKVVSKSSTRKTASAKIISLEKSEKSYVEKPERETAKSITKDENLDLKKRAPLTIEKPKSKTNLLKQVVKYAAVAALVPVAFYSFWIPLNTDVLQSGVIYSQDFNPFTKSDKVIYNKSAIQDELSIDSVKPLESLEEMTSNLSSNTTIFSYPLDDDLYVPVRLINKSKTTENLSRNNTATTQNTKNGYHLIVGCFAELNNAEDLVESLNKKGYSAAIIDQHNGLHRVSAVNSKQKKDLLKNRSEISALGLSSWVLKK
ncbi:MAG: SPOR domain-containing protein [Brumimicrobium sp.]